MPLRLNVIVPNKAVHAFIAFIVIVALVIGVYALGALPEPVGHPLDQVQGYFDDDASLVDTFVKM